MLVARRPLNFGRMTLRILAKTTRNRSASALRGLVFALGFALFAGPAVAATHVLGQSFSNIGEQSANHPNPFEQPLQDFHAISPENEPWYGLPYRNTDHEEFGLALQLAPVFAGSEIRWRTSTTSPAQTAIANTKPHVWVKIVPKPNNQSFFLGFVLALFVLSTSGVMLMWRQIAKSSESERPGWERWQQ